MDRIKHARILLRWYRREHRKLAWRSAPGTLADPYAVLVSEAMLQQTQVATVQSYFDSFMQRFPELQALADADEQAVLEIWQGMGYYRRARHLHQAARTIMHEHAGRIPEDEKSLRKLPGVGRYTAGAIASLAFGRFTPIVDGNVMRVFSRWHGYDQPTDTTEGQKWMWAQAEQWLDVGRGHKRWQQWAKPGDWNSALMELGARICLPRAPLCMFCPVRATCIARQQGTAENLPIARRRAKVQSVTHHMVAVESDAHCLFIRRAEDQMWAGLWQLLTLEQLSLGRSSVRSRAGRGRIRKAVGQALAAEVEWPDHIGRFEHVTTHRRITFELWRVGLAGEPYGISHGMDYQWVRWPQVAGLPISAAQKRALKMLENA